MTSTSPASYPPLLPSAHDTIDIILYQLLPVLFSSALSVKSLVGRWRFLHSKLSILHSSLSAAASASPHSSANPLFTNLLLNLLTTLHSLESLSSRCLDPTLPDGKLLLQSDLDITTASLSLHLHDLKLLLRSGLLNQPDSHSTAIVLSLPSPSASRTDLSLFVRDLFARLQIGALDLKIKALDSLLQFLTSDPAKLASLVAQEGDLSFLIRLLDQSSHSLIRDSAAAAISVLATASDSSRRILLDEGAIGPLLSLLQSGSLAVKEKAAAAIQAIAADTPNAWAVAAYGGISVLINACRPGSSSPAVQSLAASSLNCIASIDELRTSLAEEGAIPVIIDLLTSSAPLARKNAALCLWSLASFGGEAIRVSIIKEGGLQNLLQQLRDSSSSDSNVSDHSLRAIHALSFSPPGAEILSASAVFLTQLTDLIRFSSSAMQLTAAAVLSNLLPADELKQSMAPVMPTLVKILESSKPTSAQETATRALISLLAVRSNRKELARDGKSMMRLIQMLDHRKQEVCHKFPISIILALASGGGGGSCRRRLAEAGACSQLQKLADVGVPGAQKALQRISGGRFKNLLTSLVRRD